MSRFTRTAFFLVLTVVLCTVVVVRVPAQLRPQPVGELPGEQSLQLMLRKLASIGTFMQTTAHPDDEDNALLAMLSHGRGMRTVLVTATRGDGGQNEIGPELFQSLGVLRTEELLAVHRFDGAEQYFTRAVDFGFSFSVEESIQKWGHDEIVGDFVRHIRSIRPDVIAGFLCGGEGGGQHHQASARLTVEAFHAAADPTKYPDQIKAGLRPWQAQRVFCTEFSGPGRQLAPAPDLVTVDVSGFDAVLGRTFSELGLEARSMHKCQGTSQLLSLPGQTFNRSYRLRGEAGVSAGSDAGQTGVKQGLDQGQTGVKHMSDPGLTPFPLFHGIDTRLEALTKYAGTTPPAALTSAVHTIASSVADATKAAGSGSPSNSIPSLVSGLDAVRSLRGKLSSFGLNDDARYVIGFRLEQKEAEFQQALVLASGTRIEALADDGIVIPGQPLKVSFATGSAVDGVRVNSVTMGGLESSQTTCTGTVPRGGAYTCQASTSVPRAAKITGPYWTPRQDAARYDFDPGVPFGLPFAPSPFAATFHITIGGADVTVDSALQFRYDDVFAGEKRMELSVVPAFSVRLTPDIVVVPAATVGGTAATNGAAVDTPNRDVQVVVTNQHKGAADGVVSLELPQGWQATPVRAPVKFTREDEAATVRFSIAPVARVGVGDYRMKAVVSDNAGAYDSGYEVVEYPHIHRRHVPLAATSRVKVIDVAVPRGVRVGYIMGVGDQVPQALAQLGAQVEMISPDMLASGDLSRYNVIMTGVRAYERRPDLRANNYRLLQYAEQGGTVLVQYNKFEFNDAQYGPYPARVSSNRVTDENAPVEVLVPDHPVFNTPNKIGPETWADWVQERGLYFLGDRDPRYVDLVRMTDPFEYNRGPKTGALVEATIGKGCWIYIGLGLWRQLPAGTVGAYRLMANLLSLR
jgi:LmbE family N-acetylglucosaminyl deacetylase